MPNITEEEYQQIMSGQTAERFIEMSSEEYRRIMGLEIGKPQEVVTAVPKAKMGEREVLQTALRLLIELEKDLCPYVDDKQTFHATRKWRFDFAWPEEKVAIEIQGGIHSQGRHVRPEGYEEDCHKLNEAQLHGWIELYVTAKQIRDGSAIRYLKRALDMRRGVGLS